MIHNKYMNNYREYIETTPPPLHQIIARHHYHYYTNNQSSNYYQRLRSIYQLESKMIIIKYIKSTDLYT